MSEITCTEGIMALSGMEEHIDDPFFKEGLILALTGTELALSQSLLETRKRTLIYLHETRYRMIIAGMTSIQAGDNPRIVAARLSCLYEGVDKLSDAMADEISQHSVVQLHSKLQNIPFSQMDFDEIREVFLNMAVLARREGIRELQELPGLIDEDLMKDALRLVIEGTSPDLIRDQHNARAAILLKHHEMRYRIIIAGIQSIQFLEEPHLVRAKMESLSGG